MTGLVGSLQTFADVRFPLNYCSKRGCTDSWFLVSKHSEFNDSTILSHELVSSSCNPVRCHLVVSLIYCWGHSDSVRYLSVEGDKRLVKEDPPPRVIDRNLTVFLLSSHSLKLVLNSWHFLRPSHGSCCQSRLTLPQVARWCSRGDWPVSFRLESRIFLMKTQPGRKYRLALETQSLTMPRPKLIFFFSTEFAFVTDEFWEAQSNTSCCLLALKSFLPSSVVSFKNGRIVNLHLRD